MTGYKGEHTFYCKDKSTLEEWLEKLGKVSVFTDLCKKYSFGKLLGRGCFARVHLAARNSDNLKVAIKTIDKLKILKSFTCTDSVIGEIKTLRMLDHPNIIKLMEVYEDDIFVHLVMEYLEGGELFCKLKSNVVYSEKDAALAVKDVLEALKYCHERNIIHRDLKPENLILVYSYYPFILISNFSKLGTQN